MSILFLWLSCFALTSVEQVLWQILLTFILCLIRYSAAMRDTREQRALYCFFWMRQNTKGTRVSADNNIRLFWFSLLPSNFRDDLLSS